jgi:predicted DNA-binding helix-hairpin-helix protein
MDMASIILNNEPFPEEKLLMMQEDARFDVADDDRACIPDLSSFKTGIRANRSPPKVPKVFLSNNCIFNCAYCGCRCTHDKRRYASPPKELAELSVKQARAGSRGIFITSAIYKNPDYTQELIIETLKIIRRDYSYKGYLHAKVMPGADRDLINQTGKLANRLR